MLGLEGFELVAVDEHGGGLELAVQTTADLVGCPGCGAVATVYLAHLRRKLEPDPTHPRYLITEPGRGYRFEPSDAR